MESSWAIVVLVSWLPRDPRRPLDESGWAFNIPELITVASSTESCDSGGFLHGGSCLCRAAYSRVRAWWLQRACSKGTAGPRQQWLGVCVTNRTHISLVVSNRDQYQPLHHGLGQDAKHRWPSGTAKVHKQRQFQLGGSVRAVQACGA